MLRRALIFSALLAFGLSMLPPGALGQALDKPTFVVALDKLDGDPKYARSVMLAVHRPDGGGHVGVILNRPSPYSMQMLFPGEDLVKDIKENAYRGGPHIPSGVAAVAKSETSPGKDSIAVAPGVWVILDSDEMDAFIAKAPNEARYYIGVVLWRPGALAEEVRKGWVVVKPVDPGKLFLPDTSKMYDELVPPGRKPGLET